MRRSAFDQLGYSWLLLLGTLAGLVLLFVVPPGLTIAGIALGVAGTLPGGTAIIVVLLAAVAWALSAAAYLPAVRYFGLPPAWALTLPLGGLLYGGMTADSARRHLLGHDRAWA